MSNTINCPERKTIQPQYGANVTLILENIKQVSQEKTDWKRFLTWEGLSQFSELILNRGRRYPTEHSNGSVNCKDTSCRSIYPFHFYHFFNKL